MHYLRPVRRAGRLGRNAHIEFFFAPPTRPEHLAYLGSTLSTLYLLRREAQDCLIGTVLDESQVFAHPERHRLFATAMVLMAGIDLLAKFAAGDDDGRGVGRRFMEYLDAFADGMTRTEAERLYGIRNALLHSFGLHDRGEIPKGRTRLVRRKFVLTETCDRPREEHTCIERSGRYWSLCVEHLYEAFVLSVASYRGALGSSMELKKNFTKMFDKYGYLNVVS